MKILTTVLVGSRLHNLHNKDSDYDYRGIFVNDLKEFLSPFKKIKNRHWIEGNVDNTSYELADFCKFATKGNPTILEVFWSNKIKNDTEEMKELRINRHKFLDSTAIFNAHRGYAHNQYKKMSLFQPDDRTPKFAIAYVRCMQEAISILETGEYECQITRNRDFLLDVKYNWESGVHIPKLSVLFSELEKDLTNVYLENKNRFKPDFEWIENFIYNVYSK